MQTETIQIRASQDTKRLAGEIAQRMDLSVGAVIRLAIHEKAKELGVTLQQNDRTLEASAKGA